MVTMALRPYVQGQVYKEGWNLNAWLGLSLGGMIALQQQLELSVLDAAGNG